MTHMHNRNRDKHIRATHTIMKNFRLVDVVILFSPFHPFSIFAMRVAVSRIRKLIFQGTHRHCVLTFSSRYVCAFGHRTHILYYAYLNILIFVVVGYAGELQKGPSSRIRCGVDRRSSVLLVNSFICNLHCDIVKAPFRT